jgi:hypothetical protein
MTLLEGGTTWEKWITGGVPWKNIPCPCPSPSPLPGHHEVSKFALPPTCTMMFCLIVYQKQWSQMTLDWNHEPKQICFSQVFCHSDKRPNTPPLVQSPFTNFLSISIKLCFFLQLTFVLMTGFYSGSVPLLSFISFAFWQGSLNPLQRIPEIYCLFFFS